MTRAQSSPKTLPLDAMPCSVCLTRSRRSPKRQHICSTAEPVTIIFLQVADRPILVCAGDHAASAAWMSKGGSSPVGRVYVPPGCNT
jgi:hypothetical protein